ncbi:MAG: alkaline phosphatase [Planctomycetota bacterium]
MKTNYWKKVWVLILVGVIGLVSTAQAEPKNVIIFIGDGMGFEQVKAAGMYVHGYDYGDTAWLPFELFPYNGELTTYSANASVTDSAAASTALATGFKVNNGVVSMAYPEYPPDYPEGSELETLLEYSKAEGKSTGLVTSVYVTHATPAGFGAHEADRNNYSQIANDYLTQTRPNVIFGGSSYMSGADGAGYTEVFNRADMLALDTETETMVSGQFGSGDMPYEYDGDYSVLPHLSEMTATALSILDNDADGFFLMVEGGNIDHACHDNHTERTVLDTVEFANAVQEVIDWAAGRTDTLILVCADHETGGLTVTGNNGQGNYPSVTWSSGGHTAANVPVYAWGENAELISGIMNNTDMFGVATATISPEASNPSPADGAGGVDIETDLGWTAGAGAISHDVYFGTTTPPAFVQNQSETTFEPGTLAPNTMYYWRIDEFDGTTTHTGAVWSFTTAAVPGAASSPSPADGATDVPANADLSWTAGSDATSHDVYFGSSDPPDFVQNQAGTTYDPGTLASEATYYWRIDEVGPGGVTTGVVWSFTTESVPDAVADSDIPVKGTIGGSYVDTQDSDDIYETITEAHSGGKPSNRYSTLEHKWTISVIGGDTVTFYVEAYKSDNDDGDDFVFAYSMDDSSYTDIVTVTKTIDDDTVQNYVLPASTSGTVYIRVEDTDSTAGNMSFDTISIDHMYIKCTGVSTPDNDPPTPDPMTWATAPYATGSSSIAMVATTASDASGVEYYFTCTSGSGHDSGWQESPSYEDTGLSPETTYTYTVKARDKSADQNETQPSTEASAITDPPTAPGQATDPTPSDEQTRVNNRSVILSWIAGADAVSHDVYLGTDYHNVLTADKFYSEFVGNQTETTYDPPTLERKTTYYWRIDEVNAVGTTTGVVWSFTTK